MEISELKTELEKLHDASFGWALTGVRSVNRPVFVVTSVLLVIAAAGYFALRAHYEKAQTPSQNTTQVTPQEISTPEPRELLTPDKFASGGTPVKLSPAHPKTTSTTTATNRAHRYPGRATFELALANRNVNGLAPRSGSALAAATESISQRTQTISAEESRTE